MSSHINKKLKTDDTFFQYTLQRALDNYNDELNDYKRSGGGTVSRMCLESVRYIAQKINEVCPNPYLDKLETLYNKYTNSRKFIQITNQDTSKHTMCIFDKVINVKDKEQEQRIKNFINLCRRELDAKNLVKDLAKDTHDMSWLNDRWNLAEQWITFYYEKQGYFETNDAVEALFNNWPYENNEAIPVFKSILMRYGFPYYSKSWKHICKNKLYVQIFQDNQLCDSTQQNLVTMCNQIKTVQDFKDIADLCESVPELLLIKVLNFVKDKTFVEAWCTRFNKSLDTETDIKLVLTKTNKYSSTTIDKLIEMGYLAPAPESNNFYYYEKRWKN
jgi:hypothetical protein